jgi:hypothetical protein
MNLPGETEAGSAGMQPCCGITRRAHRTDAQQRGRFFSRVAMLTGRSHRMIDPHALKIPARRGGIYTNGERRFSISG